MATVRKVRGHWVVDFRDQDGRRRVERPKGPFENMTLERLAAQSLLTERLSQVSRGDDIAMIAQLKFSEVCDRYMDSKV